MRKFLKIITNKYVLAILVFLGVMLIFDPNNWFVQHQRQKALEETETNIDFLKTESAKMEKQLNDLNTDSNYLEKYAREHYHEKRDNEDVFLIIKDSTKETK